MASFDQKLRTDRRTIYTEMEILDKFGLDIQQKKGKCPGIIMMINKNKERVLGKIKKEKSIIDFFTGAGTGIIVSCLLSPDSIRRIVVIIIGLVMIGIGWYKKTRYDNKVFRYMEEFKEDS